MQLYTWKTPNGQKPLIALAETGLDCEIHHINLSQNDQTQPTYLALNPNGKIPVLVDEKRSIFESGAILWHLAEKSGLLLPKDPVAQSLVRQWMFWEASNLGPAVVQLGHFLFRDEKIPYAIDRFADICVRFLRVLNANLKDANYVAGDYSIADVALYPFVSIAWNPLAEIRPEAIADLTGVKVWLERIYERPGVKQALARTF